MAPTLQKAYIRMALLCTPSTAIGWDDDVSIQTAAKDAFLNHAALLHLHRLLYLAVHRTVLLRDAAAVRSNVPLLTGECALP